MTIFSAKNPPSYSAIAFSQILFLNIKEYSIVNTAVEISKNWSHFLCKKFFCWWIWRLNHQNPSKNGRVMGIWSRIFQKSIWIWLLKLLHLPRFAVMDLPRQNLPSRICRLPFCRRQMSYIYIGIYIYVFFVCAE